MAGIIVKKLGVSLAVAAGLGLGAVGGLPAGDGSPLAPAVAQAAAASSSAKAGAAAADAPGSAFDQAILDDMTLDQLYDLRGKVNERIDELERKGGGATGGESAGIWSAAYYVDEFKQPTDDGYVRSEAIEGTFSNSATTNSRCSYIFVIDDWSISLDILEYGRSRVQGMFGDTDYTVKVRTGSGDEWTCSATLMNGDDRVYIGLFDSEAREKWLSAFERGDKISVFIEEEDGYGVPDSYLFTVDDTSGFASVYRSLFGDVE